MCHLSTSEAEYVALGDAVKELFLRQVWRFMIPGYERDLGVTHDWNSALEDGQPGQKLFSRAYMAFITEEQKKAGVEVSQAHAMLHSHLTAIIAHMTLRIRCTQDPYDRIVLARDIALPAIYGSVQYLGKGRWVEPYTHTAHITTTVPNECGSLFNFQ